MPVISVANSKGGSGKTTAALILAGELAQGADVILIDADPRRPAISWFEQGEGPKRLKVINSGGEREIHDEIDEAAQNAPFVIIDLEGTASRLASYAMAESDLVIIPAQEQHQDAAAAIDTLGEVKRAGRSARREIPSVIVLTRTKVAVKSRTAKLVGGQLRDHEGIHVLQTEIAERDAFSAIFSTGTCVRDLDPREVNGIDKAVANAEAFAVEIVEALR